MTDLEQVTCGKCAAVYHRELRPDVFYFRSLCGVCAAAQVETTTPTYSYTLDFSPDIRSKNDNGHS